MTSDPGFGLKMFFLGRLLTALPPRGLHLTMSKQGSLGSSTGMPPCSVSPPVWSQHPFLQGQPCHPSPPLYASPTLQADTSPQAGLWPSVLPITCKCNKTCLTIMSAQRAERAAWQNAVKNSFLQRLYQEYPGQKEL